jgi:hypothetical protein
MKIKAKNLKTNLLVLAIICSLLITTLGCDSFVRKFTRKSKNEKNNAEELVLMPQEYKPPKITKEDTYRKYFLYWKSWQDELITALTDGLSDKKRIDCANQAIKNLEEMRNVLQQANQQKLDVYIRQLSELRDDLMQDTYGGNLLASRMTAERIKRNILRDFSYDKIKNNLA